MTDDLDLHGCHYVFQVDKYRFSAEDTYLTVDWLKDDLREPIGKAFNLTKEESDAMSFMDMYGYCDVVQSDIFEFKDPPVYSFTEEQLNQMNQTVLATLVLPLSDPVLSRNMYISKLLRLPLSMMTRYVEA